MPDFISQLDYASAYYDLPKGKVSVSWKRTEAGVELLGDCPVEYTVTISEKYKADLIE